MENKNINTEHKIDTQLQAHLLHPNTWRQLPISTTGVGESSQPISATTTSINNTTANQSSERQIGLVAPLPADSDANKNSQIGNIICNKSSDSESSGSSTNSSPSSSSSSSSSDEEDDSSDSRSSTTSGSSGDEGEIALGEVSIYATESDQSKKRSKTRAPATTTNANTNTGRKKKKAKITSHAANNATSTYVRIFDEKDGGSAITKSPTPQSVADATVTQKSDNKQEREVLRYKQVNQNKQQKRSKPKQTSHMELDNAGEFPQTAWGDLRPQQSEEIYEIIDENGASEIIKEDKDKLIIKKFFDQMAVGNEQGRRITTNSANARKFRDNIKKRKRRSGPNNKKNRTKQLSNSLNAAPNDIDNQDARKGSHATSHSSSSISLPITPTYRNQDPVVDSEIKLVHLSTFPLPQRRTITGGASHKRNQRTMTTHKTRTTNKSATPPPKNKEILATPDEPKGLANNNVALAPDSTSQKISTANLSETQGPNDLNLQGGSASYKKPDSLKRDTQKSKNTKDGEDGEEEEEEEEEPRASDEMQIDGKLTINKKMTSKTHSKQEPLETSGIRLFDMDKLKIRAGAMVPATFQKLEDFLMRYPHYKIYEEGDKEIYAKGFHGESFRTKRSNTENGNNHKVGTRLTTVAGAETASKSGREEASPKKKGTSARLSEKGGRSTLGIQANAHRISADFGRQKKEDAENARTNNGISNSAHEQGDAKQKFGVVHKDQENHRATKRRKQNHELTSDRPPNEAVEDTLPESDLTRSKRDDVPVKPDESTERTPIASQQRWTTAAIQYTEEHYKRKLELIKKIAKNNTTEMIDTANTANTENVTTFLRYLMCISFDMALSEQ